MNEGQKFLKAAFGEGFELCSVEEGDPKDRGEQPADEGSVSVDETRVQMFENAFDFVPALSLMIGKRGRGEIAGVDEDDFAGDFLNFRSGFLGRCVTVGDDTGAAIAEADGDAPLGGGMEGVGIDAAGKRFGFLAKFRVDAAEAFICEKDARALGRMIETPAKRPTRKANDRFAACQFARRDPALSENAVPFFTGDFDQVLSAAPGATVAGPVLNDRQVQLERHAISVGAAARFIQNERSRDAQALNYTEGWVEIMFSGGAGKPEIGVFRRNLFRGKLVRRACGENPHDLQ